VKNDYDGFFKSRGFYIALYACVAILIVAGVFYSVNSALRSGEAPSETVEEEAAGVGSQFDRPISESAESQISNYTDPFESQKRPDDSKAELKNEVAERSRDGALPGVSFPDLSSQNVSSPNVGLNEPEKVSEKAEAPSQETAKEEESAASEDETEELAEENIEEKTFEAFADNSRMSWPVIGTIVMDYSPDHVIYDQTLELYRTNDSIWIAGEIGSQVKATADGVVESIEKGSQYGNTVVIDNGNGWKTTYAQLQDNILVSEGDVVRAGQVLGGINNPTSNASVQGAHLNLQITKDDQSIDPKLVLAQ
jgi:murein DD-endopeptidase MepM/ murein hydrolase activator NlpD